MHAAVCVGDNSWCEPVGRGLQLCTHNHCIDTTTPSQRCVWMTTACTILWAMGRVFQLCTHTHCTYNFASTCTFVVHATLALIVTYKWTCPPQH